MEVVGVVFIATNHFLAVASFLPRANSLYATGKYTHSLYATGPTCHRHQKIYLYATQCTQGMSIKSDGIPGIFSSTNRGWSAPLVRTVRPYTSMAGIATVSSNNYIIDYSAFNASSDVK
jgi:hypothetical protein